MNKKGEKMKILYLGSFLLTLTLSLITYNVGYNIADAIIMILFWNSILYGISLDKRYLDTDLSNIKIPLTFLRCGLALFNFGLFYHYIIIIKSIL